MSWVLLSALLVLVGRATTDYLRQQSLLAGRQLLLMEAANVMEQVFARSPESLVPGALDDIRLASHVTAAAPGAQLRIDVLQTAEQPAWKKIIVEISDRNRSGESGAPIRLVAWRYVQENLR